MDSYDHKLSIGYICNVSALLRSFDKVFDRVGVSMWAVKALVEADFKDFLQDIEEVKLFQGTDRKFVQDAKYKVRLGKKPEKVTEQYKSKMRERAQVFLNTLAAAQERKESVLLVRCEEATCYPDWGERLEAVDEKKHVEAFSDMLKAKYPTLQFKILYMSQEGFFLEELRGIVGIPRPASCYRNARIMRTMDAHMAQSDIRAYLQEHL